MALNIAYFKTTDRASVNVYEELISSTPVTVTASSASCGAIPNAASIARLAAGEACYVSNNDAPASSTNGIYLAAGVVADVQVVNGKPLRAITG